MKEKVENTLNDEKFMKDLSEVLEKENVSFKISTTNDKMKLDEIKIGNQEVLSNEKDNNDLNKATEKKENKLLKFIGAFGRVFEEFFDSIAKKFLKGKLKLNYSVYNDGKKAIIAAKNKDKKTFFKKVTDSLLYVFKKIPSETKKVIKNTKNAVIDEIFAWKNE